MSKRDLLSINGLDYEDICRLTTRACEIAASDAIVPPVLKGKAIGIYFRKTSTRTRTSFSVGAMKLGAGIVAFGPGDLQTNTGESLRDTGRVLAGYLDALVVRTAESIAEMQQLADQDSMAVINAMSDAEHPTQALADMATLAQHFGTLHNLRVLYLGEGNNTAAALALCLSRVPGTHLLLAMPARYSLPEGIVDQAKKCAAAAGCFVEVCHTTDRLSPVFDVVYTTRWQTTGTQKLDPYWREHFSPFRVTPEIMRRAAKDPATTVFMHDLPAVIGEDVDQTTIEGPQSIVLKQARFKMYSAMAVLEWCLTPTPSEQLAGFSLSAAHNHAY